MVSGSNPQKCKKIKSCQKKEKNTPKNQEFFRWFIGIIYEVVVMDFVCVKIHTLVKNKKMI